MDTLSTHVFKQINGRGFRGKWLQSHTWLRYSAKLNVGVCAPCTVMGKTQKQFGDFSNITKNLKRHELEDEHKLRVVQAENLVLCARGQQTNASQNKV